MKSPFPTVKEMNAEQRPRERAMRFGIQSLSIPDLLAIVLRTGMQGVPVTEVCRRLMADNNDSLLRLERRSRSELMLSDGIGAAKALQIEAVMELMRRYQREALARRSEKVNVIRSSSDIYERICSYIANLDHEEIWIILLNQRHEVLLEFRATSGSAVASVFDSKMIIKRALLEDAVALAMCHNHPSGNLQPSVQDDNITRKLRDACASMDIRLIDHLIVSPAGYYSYSDRGRL